MENWMVPDGLYDLLPEQTRKIEYFRQAILNEMSSWGYEHVMPPMAEYLQSIQSKSNSDLSLATVKFQDLASGYTLGIRPDFTTQVSRIDSSQLNANSINRLCYVGEVLRNQVTANSPRSPIHIGAELLGSASIDSSLEILQLALSLIKLIAKSQYITNPIKPVLVINNPAFFHKLLEHLNMEEQEQEQELYEIFLRGSKPDLIDWLNKKIKDEDLQNWTLNLFDFQCSEKKFKELINKKFPASFNNLLGEISFLISNLRRISNYDFNENEINFDLADLRSFSYHTGIVFTIFDAYTKTKLAWGGRYNSTNQTDKISREAIGLTMDLRQIVNMLQSKEQRQVINCPRISKINKAEKKKIDQLRKEGKIVVHSLG